MSTATLHAPCALLPDGWARDVRVTINAHGVIVAVARDTPARAADTRLDKRALLPAPANLHSHAFQRALAGRTQHRAMTSDAPLESGNATEDSFWTWRTLMYRFVDALTPDLIEAISAQAQVEMLEAGYAAVAEFHYIHHAPGGIAYANPAETSIRVMSAARMTGIGLTLLPVVYATAGADGRPPAQGQLRFACDAERYEQVWQCAQTALANGAPDWRIGIAPHSLRAVPAQILDSVLDAHPRGPIHLHIAEQLAEVEEIRTCLGSSPVTWLLDNYEVDERWCLIHATHVDEAECHRLAASGATVGLCPLTEADLGDGLFPAASYLVAGGRFGVGTDSNVRVTLAGELQMLEYGQRLAQNKRNVLSGHVASTARTLFDRVLDGGARALDRNSGAIKPGCIADLVTLNTSDDGDLSLYGLKGDDLLDAWIFSARDAVVSDVWSAGRHLVRDGRHVARDEIARRYRQAIDALMRAA